MSSPSSNISGRKRKRGVTRRVRDDQGNIRVIKYQKASSGLRIPGLTWGKLPSLLLGLPLAIYSGLIYSNRNGYLEEGGIGKDILNSTDELSAAMKLIVTGTIGMVLSGFLAYALIRKGFKIRRYPAVSREIVAIWATFIVLSAILSPFVNEPGLVRQQSDDDFVPDDRDFDVSGLNSPFYSEFLNGLLDLLGNIPDPKEEVAYIRPTDGQGLDYFQDRYLYRWRVAETYDTGLADFNQAYTSTKLKFIDGSDPYGDVFTGSNYDQARALNIQEQYLTISSSYSGDALVPWNSEYGGMITNDFASMSADVSNNGSLVDGSISGYRDINEQPVLSMSFDTPRTQGFVNYDSYWVADDKEFIGDNSVLMGDLATELNNYDDLVSDQTRFGDLAKASGKSINETSEIWGLNSLPGDSAYAQDTGDGADFAAQYDKYNTILKDSMSLYNFILLVNNDIQNAVIKGLTDNSLNIDPTATSGVADPGADKAYWFYRALQDPDVQFGMKELLAGYVNMLRSFDIPARPIIGFSVGNFQNEDGSDCTGGNDCDKIEILFEHLHVWIEVLIPVIDGTDTTYHWGILNPIPDPWILQNDNTDFEFGRNSLGGSPDIEIEITSGEETSLNAPVSVDPFPTTSTFFLNKMGEDIEGRVRISYDDNPAEGQAVQLRLVNESEMLTADIDPSIGLELPDVITDDAQGWGNFKLHVDKQGLVYNYLPNGSRSDIAIPNLVIGEVDPLQPLGSIGLYGFVAVYGISFNGTLTGWELDAQVSLTANATIASMINPNTGGTIDSYGVLFGSTVQFTVTVLDNETIPNPLEGISNVEFLLLSEADYNTLIVSLNLNILNANLINDNKIATFPTTDINGQSTLDVTFDQNFIDTYTKPSNEVYVGLALIQAGFKYNKDPIVFVWFEQTISMTSILLDTGIGNPIPDDLVNNGMVDANPVVWEIETNGTAFDNPGNQVFANEPAVGVQFEYYIIDKTTFDTFPTYDLLEANNIFANCQSGIVTVTSCYMIDRGGSNNGFISIVSGNGITNGVGTATLTLSLQRDGFQDSIYFYFVVVSDDFRSVAITIRFFATGAPPPPLFLNALIDANDISKPNQVMLYPDTSNFKYDISFRSSTLGLLNLLGLISLNIFINRRR